MTKPNQQIWSPDFRRIDSFLSSCNTLEHSEIVQNYMDRNHELEEALKDWRKEFMTYQRKNSELEAEIHMLESANVGLERANASLLQTNNSIRESLASFESRMKDLTEDGIQL